MFDPGLPPRFLYVSRNVVAHFPQPEQRPGSGFVVVHDGAPFLVTNRHLVDRHYQALAHGDRFPERLTVTGFETCSEHEEHRVTWTVETPSIRHCGSEDVAVVELAGASHTGPECAKLSNWFDSGKLASAEAFGSSDRSISIEPMDLVVVSGFPNVTGAQLERPIALVGFVASDPSTELTPRPVLSSGRKIESARAVLYQGFSSGGASGSPIFAPRRGLPLGAGFSGPPVRESVLIGVNVGRIPGTTSQPSAVSYFVRSDAILDALGSDPVENG